MKPRLYFDPLREPMQSLAINLIDSERLNSIRSVPLFPPEALEYRFHDVAISKMRIHGFWL